MNFAKLLLENYGKLYEKVNMPDNGYFEVLNMANAMQQGTSQEVTPPQGGIAATIGNGENGPFIKGGPFGSFSRNLNSLGDEDVISVNNWWSSQDGGISNALQDPLLNDPALQGVNEKDIQRLREIEEKVPGAIDNLKKINENAAKLSDQYPNLSYQVAKQLTPNMVKQGVFGGQTRGSLAFIIQKELDAENVRIDRTDSISFALDGIPAEDLGQALNTMGKLAEVYGKLENCEASDEDLKDIQDKVRRDGRNYFYSSDLDDKRFGMSLSLAEFNPMNMLTVGYGSYLEKCGKEEFAIPEKEIRANYNGNAGNFNDMVTNASEDVKIAAFEIMFGDEKKGKEMLMDLISKFGKDVFKVLQMKRQVQEGDHALDEMYQQAIDNLDDLGINVADDIKDAIKGPLRNYMLETMTFLNQLKPDYAVRVGRNTTVKGDKSDVDYIMKNRPDMPLPDDALVEVKFEDLSRDAQKAIIDSGDEKQDTYFMLKDSLKCYTKEGDVKLGDSYSLETEIDRLLNPDDPHGSFILDRLELDDATRDGALRIMGKMKDASSTVKRLMSNFTTESYPTEKAARKFVGDQITTILKTAGVQNIDNRQLLKDAMKEFKENGAEKAIGLIDRTIQLSILQKDMTYNSDGSLNKRNKGTMNSLAAFAAIQASIGMDSTGVDPMSEIHIMQTGNTYRENQNRMIEEPLKDLLDPKSRRSLDMGAQTWRVSEDGSTTFNVDKGRCSANCYTNTRHLKKN